MLEQTQTHMDPQIQPKPLDTSPNCVVGRTQILHMPSWMKGPGYRDHNYVNNPSPGSKTTPSDCIVSLLEID